MSEQYETGRCVIGRSPHKADHGYLCTNHEQGLRNILREIEDEAANLSTVPSMAIRMGNGSSGLASQRANSRLTVIAMNDKRTIAHGERPLGPFCPSCWHDTCQIIRRWQDAYDAQAIEIMSVLGTLHQWGRIVREERNMTGPEHITIMGERNFIDRQIIWCGEQPWISEMYEDFRKLLSQIQGLNYTGPDKPYCTCPVITKGEPCPGDVWVQDELQPVWRRYLDRCAALWEHAPGKATCDTCGAQWVTEADKARLKRMVADSAVELARPVAETGQPMLTAQEMADQLRVTVNNLRVRATRLGVKAVRGHYDPEWFAEKIAG